MGWQSSSNSVACKASSSESILASSSPRLMFMYLSRYTLNSLESLRKSLATAYSTSRLAISQDSILAKPCPKQTSAKEENDNLIMLDLRKRFNLTKNQRPVLRMCTKSQTTGKTYSVHGILLKFTHLFFVVAFKFNGNKTSVHTTKKIGCPPDDNLLYFRKPCVSKRREVALDSLLKSSFRFLCHSKNYW